MPGETPSGDILQSQPLDKMTTTQKPVGELTQNTPVFSYAQAAKGKSPSAPSPIPPSKAFSDTTEADSKKGPGAETGASSPEPSKTLTKRTASEDHVPRGETLNGSDEPRPTQPGETHAATDNGISSSDNSSEKTKPAKQIPSTPSSPDYGITSTSTLPKEDDMFSTVNGSSDATSDKQSQSSQTGNGLSKSGEKAEAEKEHIATAPWDEETPAAASLKEALPPAVNIWQQRKEAQAKSKSFTVPQQQKPSNNSNMPGNTSGPTKGPETSNEPKKQDSRKKGRNASGPLEDRTTLGATRDGSKSVDAVEKSASTQMAPPPPPGDAISWPTPDSALGEGKKKATERVEKGEKEPSQGPKPHGKEKWVHVPFVPTPVFNTPIPLARRGGKGLRGGREGGSRGGSAVGSTNGLEKQPGTGAANTKGQLPALNERDRAGLSSTSTTFNISKPKRASSAGPITPTEQRKAGDASVTEKRRDGDINPLKAGQSSGSVPNEHRRPAALSSHKDSSTNRNSANVQGAEAMVQNKVDEEAKTQNGTTEASRPSGPDRRGEGPTKLSDHPRDAQGHMPMREREGRPERGRGGYRGRGSNHNFFGHNAPNGHQPQYQPTPPPPSGLRSNHDRLPSQPQGSYQPPSQQTKHYRANSRSQSIPYSAPHATPYRGFSNGHHGGAAHLPNLQTDIANEYGYLPGHQGVMSATPYSTLESIPTLIMMVQMQIEFYFSIDNLCKDEFLRRNMDSQGYVLLAVVADFPRIRALAPSPQTIRYACFGSPNLELITFEGVDRIRRREGWKQWVYEMSKRLPSAQNEGPPPPRPQQYYNFDAPYAMDDRQASSPHANSNGIPLDQPQYQTFNGAETPFGPAVASAASNNVEHSVTQPPLSAAVSEFSPSVRSGLGSVSTPEPNSQGTSVFTDAQADQLNILVRTPGYPATSTIPPFHSTSSRTFSNGSIDGRSINEELTRYAEHQSRPVVNGDGSGSVDTNRTQRSRSPYSLGSPGPGRQLDSNVSPPVMWIKDRPTPFNPLDSLPNECVFMSYHEFRRDALKQRELSSTDKDNHDMHNLYQFWSHFLVRNFNARMYGEFRQLALEDVAQRGSTIGMQSLLQYYYESILSQKTVADDNIAHDFVNVVKDEMSEAERPAFAKLRAKWRDGAFNMKNRHKLTKFIDVDLKAELER